MLSDDAIRDYLERGVATDYAAVQNVLGDLTSKDAATSIVKTDVSFERAMKTYFKGGLVRIDDRCKAIIERWTRNAQPDAIAPAEKALIRRAVLKWFKLTEATAFLDVVQTQGKLDKSQVELATKLANFYFPGSKRDTSDVSSLYGEALRETMDEYDRLRKAFYIKAAAYKQAVAASNPEDTPADNRDATGNPTRMIPRISDQIRAAAAANDAVLEAALKAEQTRLIAKWDRMKKLRQDVVHDPYLIDSMSAKRKKTTRGRWVPTEDTLLEREAFADSLHPIRFSDEYLESVKRESNKRQREDVFRIGVLPGEMLIGIRSPPVFAEDVGLRSGTVARFGAYV